MTEQCFSTSGPVCPYCEHQDTPDEGYYYDESLTQLECGDCERTYSVSVRISTSWTTEASGDTRPEGGDGTKIAGGEDSSDA